jgi:hypothetical protein
VIYLALGIALAANLATVTLISLIARLQRQNDRARDLLLNQLLNLAGKPWQMPPAEEPPTEGYEPDEDELYVDADQVLS